MSLFPRSCDVLFRCGGAPSSTVHFSLWNAPLQRCIRDINTCKEMNYFLSVQETWPTVVVFLSISCPAMAIARLRGCACVCASVATLSLPWAGANVFSSHGTGRLAVRFKIQIQSTCACEIHYDIEYSPSGGIPGRTSCQSWLQAFTFRLLALHI
jgi:hypothetical protein